MSLCTNLFVLEARTSVGCIRTLTIQPEKRNRIVDIETKRKCLEEICSFLQGSGVGRSVARS